MTETLVPHELVDFFKGNSRYIAEEYARIRKTSSADPGTAGDEGEETWKRILQEWLPRKCPIVTKGQIISARGILSPQVDLLVLREDYPSGLISRKKYLAAGGLAAFECKNTLKKAHIKRAMETASKIKSLHKRISKTPCSELYSPILYGLLAHSHSWTSAPEKTEARIDDLINTTDQQIALHPSSQIDVVCISDLATWMKSSIVWLGPLPGAPGHRVFAEIHGNLSHPITYFTKYGLQHKPTEASEPVAVLVYYLLHRMAYDNAGLRELVDYFKAAQVIRGGSGRTRYWTTEVYSPAVRARVEAGVLEKGIGWSEWSVSFI